jgi:hypothetical protein
VPKLTLDDWHLLSPRQQLITAKADSKYQMALIRRPNAATARHRCWL